MKENITRELKRLGAFFGTGLSKDQLRQVAEYTSFSQMKSRSHTISPISTYSARSMKEMKRDHVRKGR
ncbi:hypothetical protein E2C01_067196 [Portunus trituberculatus]|uniref:Sulfotransferase domain-containing protein n=1 Tax=Portunus trituberculatus TaxID=210409 RepID=A0A5B7HS02_PORTR|nr:hypothetical protein [Portunus trituberculatus]